MPALVLFILVFVGVGTFFLFIHLLMGHYIRPSRPDAEKETIYECGEPAVGSAWIQFDLRYYVVALLFVVFDVEVAFFFPWAVVFGPLTAMAHESNDRAREKIVADHQLQAYKLPPLPGQPTDEKITQDAARSWAWIAFADILVFFSVLMVGFAYLWKRGDLDWVRSVTHSAVPEVPDLLVASPEKPELVAR